MYHTNSLPTFTWAGAHKPTEPTRAQIKAVQWFAFMVGAGLTVVALMY